jgi:hypothetical protein
MLRIPPEKASTHAADVGFQKEDITQLSLGRRRPPVKNTHGGAPKVLPPCNKPTVAALVHFIKIPLIAVG